MANKKISEATAKSTLELTDKIPVAKEGDPSAYCVTGQTVFESIPAASASSKGVVELATQTETLAGTDTLRAVTPAGLIGALGPRNMAVAFTYMGRILDVPTTNLKILARFQATFGRLPYAGDIVTFDDETDSSYFLIFEHSGDYWWGLKSAGPLPENTSFVTFR
jgi:hypothetical protein